MRTFESKSFLTIMECMPKIGFAWQWDTSAPVSTNLLHTRMIGIEETPLAFAFIVARLAIWARNCFCLDHLTICCDNWTCMIPKKEIAELCQNKAGQSFWDSYFIEETDKHSAGHRGERLMNFAKTRQDSPSNFLFHWKLCLILLDCRLKMYIPTLQRNFGWLTRQSNVSIGR